MAGRVLPLLLVQHVIILVVRNPPPPSPPTISHRAGTASFNFEKINSNNYSLLYSPLYSRDQVPSILLDLLSNLSILHSFLYPLEWVEYFCSKQFKLRLLIIIEEYSKPVRLPRKSRFTSVKCKHSAAFTKLESTRTNILVSPRFDRQYIIGGENLAAILSRDYRLSVRWHDRIPSCSVTRWRHFLREAWHVVSPT